jgi:hypothetical protein
VNEPTSTEPIRQNDQATRPKRQAAIQAKQKMTDLLRAEDDEE